MRTISEIKSNPHIKILNMGFDGMACYLNDKRYKAPREMAIIASWAGGGEYVNLHPYCLHLWKKIGEETDLPPKEFV